MRVSSPLCWFAVAQDLGILLSHIVSCRGDASLQSVVDPMGKDDCRGKEKMTHGGESGGCGTVLA